MTVYDLKKSFTFDKTVAITTMCVQEFKQDSKSSDLKVIGIGVMVENRRLIRTTLCSEFWTTFHSEVPLFAEIPE